MWNIRKVAHLVRLSWATRAVCLACVLVACTSGTQRVAVHAQAERHVSLTYLGVAGWQLSDGAATLLVDPYFSRVDVTDDAALLTPAAEQIARYAPAQADVILVEHSHYDHLLDVPLIAGKTSATIIGTESSLNVARAAGIAEQKLVRAEGGEMFALGPFSIRVLRGLHSLIGPPSSPIPRAITLPMKASDYAEGGTLQYFVRLHGRSVLFIGSANFIESELSGLRPDVAVIATGLREKIPDYACRLMRALGQPPKVLTNHFDAHWKPLDPTQMSLGDEARANLTSFAAEIHACAPKTQVIVPTHLRAISL